MGKLSVNDIQNWSLERNPRPLVIKALYVLSTLCLSKLLPLQEGQKKIWNELRHLVNFPHSCPCHWSSTETVTKAVRSNHFSHCRLFLYHTLSQEMWSCKTIRKTETTKFWAFCTLTCCSYTETQKYFLIENAIFVSFYFSVTSGEPNFPLNSHRQHSSVSCSKKHWLVNTYTGRCSIRSTKT